MNLDVSYKDTQWPFGRSDSILTYRFLWTSGILHEIQESIVALFDDKYFPPNSFFRKAGYAYYETLRILVFQVFRQILHY